MIKHLPILFSLVPGVLAATPNWTYIPQHSLYTDYAPVFVDLDGDGENEVVYQSFVGDLNNRIGAIGLLKQVDDDFLLVDTHTFSEHVVGSALTIHHAGESDTLMVSIAEQYQADSLYEVGGNPLKVIRSLGGGMNLLAWDVVDLDGDGRREILTTTNYGPNFPDPAIVVLDYETGSTKWIRSGRIGALVTQQLDSDSALEIVVAGPTGLVLDGVSGGIDWSYPAGFGSNVVAGRFDTNPMVRTFATLSQANLQIFRSNPYSPVRQIPISGWQATVFDVNNDGVDEIIQRSNLSRQIPIWDSTGAGNHRTIQSPWRSSTLPGLGRVSEDGPLLLVHGSQETGSPGMAIIDANTNQLVHSRRYERGPFHQAGFGDLDGDGLKKAVLFSGHGGEHFFQGGIQTFDESGRLLNFRAGVSEQWYPPNMNPIMHMADVDGVPGDEIIVAFGDQISQYVLLDGVSLQDRWRIVAAFGSPLDGKVPLSVATADFDKDGVQDIVFLTRTWPNQMQLIAMSGSNGAVLWESVSLTGSGAGALQDLLTLPGDGETGEMLLLATGGTVYAFDVDSRLLEWILPVDGANSGSITGWRNEHGCGIGVPMVGGQINLYRCSDQELVDTVPIPENVQMIVSLDGAGHLYAVAAEDRLYLSRRGGNPRLLSDSFGPNLSGSSDIAVKSLMPVGGQTDLLLGSASKLVSFRIDDDPIFADGLEVQAN